MFKRVTTFLTVLFMGLVLTVRSPVKADTFSIPFSAIPDLLNAFYTVAAGGKIEFSALIGDITGIDDFLENLHDYYNEHYTQPLLQSTQGLINIGLSGLALEGIDSIDNNNNLSIPITPQDLANFMGYDVNWVDRYNDVDNVNVNPDPQFDIFIDRLNGSGFDFIRNLQNFNFRSPSFLTQYTWYNNLPWTNYSFFMGARYYSEANWDLNNIYISAPIFATPLQDIYITSSQGVYSVTINNQYSNLPICYKGGYDSNTYMPEYGNYLYSFYDGDYGQVFLGNGYVASDSQWISQSYSGSLGQVFSWLQTKCRNVNIYVDGELWAYVGDVASPGISLNDSTAVGDTGNITYGVFPITSTGDIGLDLAKWGEYIFNKCISGVDTLTMDTVIDDGWDLVDTDEGDRAITQDDEEDVAKVIHGFVDSTATTPTPTPDIGDPPVLKIIPPILDLPDEIWPDGGRDTTVLAQMVHATDVAIPNDIMTIIWSTIGLLVVGGLISILHK